MNKIRILIIASIPQPPDLASEIESIEKNISMSHYKNHFDKIEIKVVDDQDDIERYINEVVPTIFHFTGHTTNNDKISVKGRDISDEFIKRVFLKASTFIKCVFLNACSTEGQAKVIHASIPCVIGTTKQIRHSNAIIFASAFYKALSNGESLESSFSMAKTTLIENDNSNEFKSPDYYSFFLDKSKLETDTFVPVRINKDIESALIGKRPEEHEEEGVSGTPIPTRLYFSYRLSIDAVNIQISEERLPSFFYKLIS